MRTIRLLGALGLFLMLIGCGFPRWSVNSTQPAPAAQAATMAPSATVTSAPSPTYTAAPSSTPTAMSTSTDTPLPTPTASVTPFPTATATPDPYAGLTIADLRARAALPAGAEGAYGQGELRIDTIVEATDRFTRTLITYPSDGLSIAGFMNIPKGQGPFPVAIVLHGYIEPNKYRTLAYTTRYADALARGGYLTIHPNLRGYPPSDDGPNRFRVGMAVDTLNLIALVRQQAGKPGPLALADGSRIGMMGHSMGGGIALRVITVDSGVKAAVLYGSMSADERTNYEQVKIWTGGQGGQEELRTPAEDLARLSPATYLGDITAAISIHHSRDDQTVPFAWSVDLDKRLRQLGKTVEFLDYSATPHTFQGESDRLFRQRMVAFFDQYVKG